MTRKTTYLDYNATAPLCPVAKEAIIAAMDIEGNPSSVHGPGRAARKMVEDARVKVAALVGARPRDVVFTSGGTEASNLTLKGSGAQKVFFSAVEHDCVSATAKGAVEQCEEIPVTFDGLVDLQALAEMLKKTDVPFLVSVMTANNETGVIQPIEACAQLAHAYGGRFHTDSVQAAGRLPLDITAFDADYLTLSAHKIGGPKGVGAVVLKGDAPLQCKLLGGGQELGRRSGTENVVGIAGFGAASAQAMVQAFQMTSIEALRDRLESDAKALNNRVIVAGAAADRVANTSCLILPGVRGETQVMHMDLAGVAVSSGSACSSGKVKVSHVLGAMGYGDEEASSSIRVSLGPETTEQDIETFLAAYGRLIENTQKD